MVRPIVVYIKLERSAEMEGESVILSDVASIECLDDKVKALVKNLCIFRFPDKNPDRTVISVLHIIQLIEEKLHKEYGVVDRDGRGLKGSEVIVQSVGEPDVFVQRVKHKSQMEKQQNGKPQARRPNWIKIALVCLVTLCGSTFTIMAYHNDIGINNLFEGIVRLIMPQDLRLGLMVLEIAYSIGLGTGIIVFFNHIGKWKISNDPTPIEVALRKYEKEVDLTQIENADRQEVEVDTK